MTHTKSRCVVCKLSGKKMNNGLLQKQPGGVSLWPERSGEAGGMKWEKKIGREKDEGNKDGAADNRTILFLSVSFPLPLSLSHCPSPWYYFAPMFLLAKKMVSAALHVVSHFGRGASRVEWMWYKHKWYKCSDIRILWTHINRALSPSFCTCVVRTGIYKSLKCISLKKPLK